MLKLTVLIFLLGCSLAAPNNKIVNGTDANIEDHPYVVSLRMYDGHTCGASILSEYWILTAGHCCDSGSSRLSVQFGTHFLSNVGNVRDVAQVILHEKYNPSFGYINDIAVIRLKQPIELSDKAQPTKLPPQFWEVPENSNDATLVGWGLEKSGGSVQERLQKVDYFIVPNEECSKIHGGGVRVTNICAAWPEGGKGQCSGDSGGPLTSNGYQVGVVSWSVKPCAIAPYPGVFTKVSHYVNWIKQKTGIQL